MEWVYCVCLPTLECWRSLLESDLEPTGEFDMEEAHLGSRYEISYDTVSSDDMGRAVEGSFRLPGHHWQVFLFTKEAVLELTHRFGTWRSGITGVSFEVPECIVINHEFITGAMSEVFGPASWIVVRGPDSLVLK